MAALATLVLVWLGAEKPDGRMKVSLDAWAATKGATLEVPRVEPSEASDGSKAIAEECDRHLNEARDQLNAGDDGPARRTLARVEQTLRDHPELLQSSWLMAERYRLEAQIAARLGESTDRWLDAADVLEGARAPAFGEAGHSASGEMVAAAIAVHGARSHETYWDGARTGDQFSTGQGEHHLAIVRGKHVAWSGWVSALVRTTFDVWIPDAPSCSPEDVHGTAFTSDASVFVPAGVRCGAWVVASPGAVRGTLRAALCRQDRCESPSIWSYENAASSETRRVSGRSFPVWATWTIAGLGFAAVTSVVMWRTGAFDRAAPAPRVGYDGSGL